MGEKDEKLPRRAFFREGLRRMIKPMIDSIAPLGEAAERLAKLAEQTALPKNPQSEHRPENHDPKGQGPNSLAQNISHRKGPEQQGDGLVRSILPPDNVLLQNPPQVGTILPPGPIHSTDTNDPLVQQGIESTPGIGPESPESNPVAASMPMEASAPKTPSRSHTALPVASRPPVTGSIARSAGRRQHWVRPPGAMKEDLFRLACSQCGVCVKACPADAIQLDLTGQRGDGLPYIVPAESPCVVCDGLHCMSECPSGALSVLAMADIRMGIAIWNEDLCTRSRGMSGPEAGSSLIGTPAGETQDVHEAGESRDACTLCVEVCPVGSAAIELAGAGIVIHEAGCIGCGLCESRCPTQPRAIVIQPISAKTH